MLFYVQVKLNLVGFIPTVRRTFTNLVAMVGYQGSKVTMTMISSNLLLYVSQGIKSNFVNYSLGIKIFQLKLKFCESMLPWQQRKYQLFLCFHA